GVHTAMKTVRGEGRGPSVRTVVVTSMRWARASAMWTRCSRRSDIAAERITPRTHGACPHGVRQKNSEHQRLDVLAPNPAKNVRNLSDRGALLHSIENERKQVLRPLRRALDASEGRAVGSGVAGAAELLQTLHLLRLDEGVHLHDGHRRRLLGVG